MSKFPNEDYINCLSGLFKKVLVTKTKYFWLDHFKLSLVLFHYKKIKPLDDHWIVQTANTLNFALYTSLSGSSLF